MVVFLYNMEKNDLYTVSSPYYGAWAFTTSDKAWKFLEDAIKVDCRYYNAGWHINILTSGEMSEWHHPEEFGILKRIDKTIDDLKEVIENVDGLDWKKIFDEIENNTLKINK